MTSAVACMAAMSVTGSISVITPERLGLAGNQADLSLALALSQMKASNIDLQQMH